MTNMRGAQDADCSSQPNKKQKKSHGDDAKGAERKNACPPPKSIRSNLIPESALKPAKESDSASDLLVERWERAHRVWSEAQPTFEEEFAISVRNCFPSNVNGARIVDVALAQYCVSGALVMNRVISVIAELVAAGKVQYSPKCSPFKEFEDIFSSKYMGTFLAAVASANEKYEGRIFDWVQDIVHMSPEPVRVKFFAGILERAVEGRVHGQTLSAMPGIPRGSSRAGHDSPLTSFIKALFSPYIVAKLLENEGRGYMELLGGDTAPGRWLLESSLGFLSHLPVEGVQRAFDELFNSSLGQGDNLLAAFLMHIVSPSAGAVGSFPPGLLLLPILHRIEHFAKGSYHAVALNALDRLFNCFKLILDNTDPRVLFSSSSEMGSEAGRQTHQVLFAVHRCIDALKEGEKRFALGMMSAMWLRSAHVLTTDIDSMKEYWYRLGATLVFCVMEGSESLRAYSIGIVDAIAHDAFAGGADTGRPARDLLHVFFREVLHVVLQLSSMDSAASRDVFVAVSRHCLPSGADMTLSAMVGSALRTGLLIFNNGEAPLDGDAVQDTLASSRYNNANDLGFFPVSRFTLLWPCCLAERGSAIALGTLRLLADVVREEDDQVQGLVHDAVRSGAWSLGRVMLRIVKMRGQQAAAPSFMEEWILSVLSSTVEHTPVGSIGGHFAGTLCRDDSSLTCLVRLCMGAHREVARLAMRVLSRILALVKVCSDSYDLLLDVVFILLKELSQPPTSARVYEVIPDLVIDLATDIFVREQEILPLLAGTTQTKHLKFQPYLIPTVNIMTLFSRFLDEGMPDLPLVLLDRLLGQLSSHASVRLSQFQALLKCCQLEKHVHLPLAALEWAVEGKNSEYPEEREICQGLVQCTNKLLERKNMAL